MTIKNILINFIAALLLLLINTLFGNLKSKSKDLFGYAGFGFNDIENVDFSGNFAQMIIHPPVFVAILASLCQYLSYEYIVKDLWLIVPFYWLFRFIIICWNNLFNLTKWKTQIELCFISILLSECVLYFIVHFFINNEKNIFISIDEFREAFWFALIAYLAKIIWDITKYKMVGETLFETKAKNNVIIQRYNKFYDRYNHYIEEIINEECYFKSKHYKKHFICLLYSIMIYEDHNRPPWIRLFEYFSKLLNYKKKYSLGIMQFQSESLISNKASIRYAIKKLYPIFFDSNLYDKISNCIYDYNADDAYYAQVIDIYHQLEGYLELKSIDFYYIDKSRIKKKTRVELKRKIVVKNNFKR